MIHVSCASYMLYVFSISFFFSENTMCMKTIIRYCCSLVSVKPVDRSEMITQLQTTEVLKCHIVMFHLLYDCTKLQMERVKLISSISNQDKWPVNKTDLVNKHIKHFNQFANSIHFEKPRTHKLVR